MSMMPPRQRLRPIFIGGAWISETIGSTTTTFPVRPDDPRLEIQRVAQVRLRWPPNFMPWRPSGSAR